MRIGLDIMGGDFAPDAMLSGVKLFLETTQEHQLVLFGNHEVIHQYITKEQIPTQCVSIVGTQSVIEMGEHPVKAIQKKPDSSIAVGFGYLRNNQIDAFASAGNTGAMLVGAMYAIKTIPGVIRPSIATLVPRHDGATGVMLDVGANADCRPDNLYQFGVLGTIYAQTVLGIEKPKVGLINIGEEEEKGNLLSQAAYKMMKDADKINFIGNIEGRDILSAKADVMVCDGFVGNVVLKLVESFHGLSAPFKEQMPYFDRLNYEHYGGSPIIGLNKHVIIGHGISSPLAVKHIIRHAIEMSQSNIIEKITEAFN